MASNFVRILRVRRTDKSSQHILLHITQISTTRPLDLKLVATEHEHLYHGDIKAAQVNSLRSEHFPGDEEELRDILLFSLLHIRPDGSTMETLRGLEMVATLQKAKQSCEITIRKNIGGITQRIASIVLLQDDEREEIVFPEWVDSAIQISERQQKELVAAQTTLDAQQIEITRLKSQLEDFIKVKREHEDDLLHKFAALLNTKKHRVRELRQLVDRPDLDDDQHMADIDVSPVGKKTTLRALKRQASPAEEEDIDMEGEGDLKQLSETPAETEDEKEGQDDAPPASSTITASRASQQHAAQSFSPAHLSQDRELPFKSQTSAGNSKKSSTRAVTPVLEDEETDDEL